MDLTGKTLRRFDNKELTRNRSENSLMVADNPIMRSSRKLFTISKNSSFINISNEEEVKQGKRKSNKHEMISSSSLTNLFNKSSVYRKQSPYSAKRNESCNNIFKPINNFGTMTNKARNSNDIGSKTNRYNEMNFIEHHII